MNWSKYSPSQYCHAIAHYFSGVRFIRSQRQRGIATTEFLVVIPALLALGLGGMQTALMYNAKNVVKYATFEAARKGSVNHAQSSAIRDELGIRIAPLFGGDGSGEKAAQAMALGLLEANDSRYTKIEILNPTQEAFEDFGIENAEGITEIPNVHLKSRERTVGSDSGVNIQDANLLKIRVTYAYELKIPLVNRLITAVLARTDRDNLQYYMINRIPITSVATVRMQSPAYEDNNISVEAGSGGGSVPGNGNGSGESSEESEEGEESENEQEEEEAQNEEGQGGSISDEEFEEIYDECQSNVQSCIGSSSGEIESCANPPGSQGGYGNSSTLGGPGASGSIFGGSVNSTPIVAQSEVTSVTRQAPSSKGGNPINIVTGNKIQREVDLYSLGGVFGLQFSRTYNSHNVGLAHEVGRGWRHSYQLNLSDHGKGQKSIVQSDGRRIAFFESNKASRYDAVLSTDGYLELRDDDFIRAIWFRRDGYATQFDRSGKAVRIISPAGLQLSFSYTADGFLRKVSDEQGRMLSFDYFKNKRLKSVFDSAGKTIRYTYDDKGNLASVIYPDGGSKRYHYENSEHPHHLTGITNEAEIRFATYQYDNQGRGISTEHHNGVGRVTLKYFKGETHTTDSLGNVSVYKTEIRDGIALVTEVRGPGCDSCGQGDIQYFYDNQKQLVKTVYKDGKTVHRRFDDYGRVSEIKVMGRAGTLLSHTRYEFEGDTHLPARVIEPSIKGEGSHLKTYQYNAFNQVVSVREEGWSPREEGFEAISKETRLVYDKKGLLTSIDGPRSDVDDISTMTYNSSNQVVTFRGPSGELQKVLAYDAYGRPTRVESRGIVRVLNYNARGQITRLVEGQRETQYTYTSTGKQESIARPSGQVMYFQYDEADRLVSVRDLAGNEESWEFDSENRMVQNQFESFDGEIFETIGYLYDLDGRVREIEKDGKRVSLQHDKSTGSVNYASDSGKSIQTHYNDSGQLLSIEKPGNLVTRFSYNIKNAMQEVEDARGNVTQYHYDDFGRLVKKESPETGREIFQYDAAGNLVAHRDAENNVKKYRYDASSRLIEANKPEGVHTLTYDINGRVLEISGPNEITRYSYTREGLVKSHTRIIDDFEYVTKNEYDKLGNLTRKQFQSERTLTYFYHASGPKVGKLRAIQREGLLFDETLLGELNTKNDSSTRTSMVFGNGIARTVQRDAYGNITTIDDEETLKLSYGFSDNGQIESLHWQNKDGEFTEQYAYNTQGGLRSANTQSGEHRYYYDKTGNRVRTDLQSANVSGHELDSKTSTQIAVYEEESNRLVGVADSMVGDRVSYNSSGSPTIFGEREYKYNSEQRPLKLYIKGKLVAEYTYNARGERIKKTLHLADREQTTYYLYEDKKLFAEANEDGEITKQYLYLDERPIVVIANDDTYIIHTDHLGSPRSITNKNAYTVWAANYDPFGKAYLNDDVDNNGESFEFNIRLPGHYFDNESGYHYNYRRTYNPNTGRYLTSDPLGQSGGLNTYLYANANPIELIDPLGLQASTPSGSSGPVITMDHVYAINGLTSCGFSDPNEEMLARQQVFSSGVDLFTSDVDMPVNTLHGSTLARIIYTDQTGDRMFGSGQVPVEHKVVFTLPKDANQAQILIGTIGTYAKREVDQIVDLPNPEILRELTYGLHQIGVRYDDVKDKDVFDQAGSVLMISADATDYDIASEVRYALGELVTHDEVIEVVRAVGLARDEGQAAMVNLEPLYKIVLKRFYDSWFKDERVVTAYDSYMADLEAFTNSGEPKRVCNQRGQGCRDTSGWASVRTLKESYENIAEEIRVSMARESNMPRYEYDKELEAIDFDAAMLVFDIVTMFTPIEWVSLAGKSVKAVARLVETTIEKSVSIAVRMGATSVASREALKEATAKFLFDGIKRRAAQLAAKYIDDYPLLASMPYEALYKVDAQNFADDALERIEAGLGHSAFKQSAEENSELLVVLGKEKSGRPVNPEDYLGKAYVTRHLSRFDDGATRFVVRSDFEQWSVPKPDGTEFVMPRADADRLLLETGGNPRLLEKALGLKDNTLDFDELVRVDFDDPRSLNVRVPNGNEFGANEQWLPGGRLPDGEYEAVIDPTAGSYRVSTISGESVTRYSRYLNLNQHPKLTEYLEQADPLNWPASRLDELDRDLADSRIGADLIDLLNASPADLDNKWLRVKEDPGYAWELRQSDPSWSSWSRTEFFKNRTRSGRHFEQDTVLAKISDRNSEEYNQLKSVVSNDYNVNLDEYDMYSQVQLTYNNSGDYFVADQLYVKWGRNAGGNIVEDYIVIENKLKSTTRLTPNQNAALRESELAVRSISINPTSSVSGNPLVSLDTLNAKSIDPSWVKIYDSDTGDVISGMESI